MAAWETVNIQCFWKGFPQEKNILIGGDLNGHVGSEARQSRGAHGSFGFEDLNEEGQSILNFSMT